MEELKENQEIGIVKTITVKSLMGNVELTIKFPTHVWETAPEDVYDELKDSFNKLVTLYEYAAYIDPLIFAKVGKAISEIGSNLKDQILNSVRDENAI